MCMRGRKSSEEEEEEGTWLQGPIGTKDITALSVCMYMGRDSRGSNNNNAKIGGKGKGNGKPLYACNASGNN